MKYITLFLICICSLTISAVAQETNADNSAKNQRDRSGETKTSGDQSNTKEDTDLTAAIRRAIVKDGSLSVTAKNVKIISEHGQVTLKGPVRSIEEKSAIEETARRIAGTKAVDSELQVAP